MKCPRCAAQNEQDERFRDLHMDYTAVGQTTHLAARMEQLATRAPSC